MESEVPWMEDAKQLMLMRMMAPGLTSLILSVKTEAPPRLLPRRELGLKGETHMKMKEEKDAPSEVMRMGVKREVNKGGVVQWDEEGNRKREV